MDRLPSRASAFSARFLRYAGTLSGYRRHAPRRPANTFLLQPAEPFLPPPQRRYADTFRCTWPFRLLFSFIMTVIDTIMRDIQSLSLRQQVEVARYVQRLSVTAQRKRVAVLTQTYGSLDETDGRAFEEALVESRKIAPSWLRAETYRRGK
jgi:hypothetical protein